MTRHFIPGIDDDYKFTDSSAHSPYVLNKKNLKNKWKQNIQVNPIFLNGKLVFISADWKVVCVDIESKKVLWELQTIFPPSRRGIVAYTKNETDYLILPIGGKTYKIDLETGKDRKGKEKIPTGIKEPDKIFTRKYKNENDIWLSRSKFDDYKKCKRCFYLITVKGFIPPGTPKFTMNSTTDKLLKKEFDLCRETQTSHNFLIKKDLGHLVPYKNNDEALNIYGDTINNSETKKPYTKMEAWRTNYHGLQVRFKKTNFILYGSVDDIWHDTQNNSLIVVDYKSQANKEIVSEDTYFKGEYKSGYQRQLDFYVYLLKQQNLNIEISDYAYLYVVNTRGLDEKFDNKLLFEATLIPAKIKTDYLENEIDDMIKTIQSNEIPPSNKKCKNCAYARQRSKIDKL